MDEAFVTRCPKCKTAFKVNPNLLAKANGKVRCGACLCVFDAEDHIQFASDELESSAPSAQPFVQNEPAKAPVKKATKAPAAKAPPKAPVEPPPSKQSSVADPVTDFSAELSGATDDDAFVFADDADNLFSDDDEPSFTEANSGIGEIDENFLNFQTDDSMRNQFEPHSGNLEAEEEDDEEAWAESLVNDSQPTLENYQLVDEPSKQAADTAKVNITERIAPVRATKKRPAKKTTGERNSASLAIDEIESRHQQGNGVFSMALWSLLALVFAGLLLVQYGWYERQSLAQHSSLRPIYDAVCELTACTLPPLQDVSQIAVSRHQVARNPNDPGTVLVDLVQRNQADFEQPFPQVIVSFMNDQGRTTQRYRANPEQYLTGSIGADELMPTGVDIQIQLVLENPGNVARYRIDLAPRP